MNNTNRPKKLELPKPSPIQPGLGTTPVAKNPDFTKKEPPRFSLKMQKRKAMEQVMEYQRNQVKALIKNIEKERASNVIVYASRNLLNANEVTNFYQLFSGNSEKFEKLDLILHSNGGIADDAFKMCRLCRQHTDKKFSVLVPYKAKSAATLLALGADELVMGPASEIGPVDPMIFVNLQDGSKHLVPAHSIKDGLDFFEGRIKAEPKTALVYSQLLENLDLTVVGAYQRAIESSKQYAETLLGDGLMKGKPTKEVEEVAKSLSEKYKSHGFVIDRDLARKEYSLNVVDAPDTIWENMWQIYNMIDVWMEEDPQIGTVIMTSNSEAIISTPPKEGGKSQT
ncbi:hypothetical protein A2773_02830 [Candidatus Gottesmanbacteria bacterium RIFCSPHIGHO2_01_FULL_39_10]|uniref:Serine dehydrogenase proteinase n=1 Tax=Candidatus Gottesmanbacteria bacterium RIFCSPHIGHO2_01_FULL_39_10 TaxID=1798375 RepID=A0A1F5ZM56_9BACT|nr:MAG: hypothetical protein A2773_02830 [Candidatus Gottesmanbacteria bacterium RIFCSPHIGHO2_01_FULL_39_10]